MFKTLRVLALLAVALVGTAAKAPAPEAPKPLSVAAKAHAATLHIAQATVLGGVECSATVVAPHSLLTATHCELPDDELAIQEIDDTVRILGRIRDDLDHTIYLVDREFPQYVELNQSDPFEQGEDVFLFGNPGEMHDIYRRGYVAGHYSERSLFSRGPDEILFDLPGFHGDSGAGIFNAQGQLVAVVTGVERQKSSDGQQIDFEFSFHIHFTDAQLKKAQEFKP